MAILRSTDTLQVGQQYTFTFEPKAVFQPSESTVKDALASFMQQGQFGDVVSASRGFFSGRFAVVFIPATSAQVSLWNDIFTNAWQQSDDLGYEVTVVQVEGGAASSAPGGVRQVVTETASGVAGTASDTMTAFIKPLAPYLILVVGGLLLYEYLKHKR